VSPSTTGTTRASSSSTETSSAPGRVDSPPTSRISAPCSASCKPWAIAASASRKRPPSEKESGVTLTTPISFTGFLACVAAGKPGPRPRVRPGALAGGPFRLRRRLSRGRRLLVVDEDLALGPAVEQGDELLGVDRLALEQDLRDRVQLGALVVEDV